TETPNAKRRRLSGSPLLATPSKVLAEVKKGEEPDDDRVLQALCNAVISAADGEEEDKEAVRLLTELLAEEGVDPNVGTPGTLNRLGGSPLYQACKLDLPEAVLTLLEHGASLTQKNDQDTPLQVALRQKGSRCIEVIMQHIEKLECVARAGRTS
ncbi:unnamed protein product, partial [Discosporangium mesarthrocarpum]